MIVCMVFVCVDVVVVFLFVYGDVVMLFMLLNNYFVF